ncbi:MAG: substrate-binding domain-containing protein [Azospirillaceae bacterium]
MIQIERDHIILGTLTTRGVASVRELQERIGSVSEVTVRRDLVRLERGGQLRRTRGGATSLSPAPAEPSGEGDIADADVLVLPPLSSHWSRTLRHNAIRRGQKLIAESAPQDGAIYVGPDNHAAGRTLGERAGRDWAERRGQAVAHILLVELRALSNTRDRAAGFVEGFRAATGREPVVHSVDGEGQYAIAFRAAADALEAYPEITVLFGVNDHSIVAALEAAKHVGRAERTLAAYSIGVEGGVVLDLLARDGALRACAALFPSVVGAITVATAVRLLNGERVARAIDTPWAVVDARTAGDYYVRDAICWTLRPDAARRLHGERKILSRSGAGGTIGLVLHYPGHDWYRNLAGSMRERAETAGLHFVARNPEDQYTVEIAETRQRIAASAVEWIRDGETIFLEPGPFAEPIAALLEQRRDLTIITSSVPTFRSASRCGRHRAILTGGESIAEDGLLGGTIAFAAIDIYRADRILLAADAVDRSFGLSCLDERRAEVLRRMIANARETTLVADHGQVGTQARARICPIDAIDTLITDSGTLPLHRADLGKAGLRVVVADDHRSEAVPAA